MNDGQPRAEKRVNKFAGCQVNNVEKLENLQLTWGLKKILAAHRTHPSKIGHFLVRLNGTSVVDWHAARTKIPACHDGNVRVETTAESWSIFRGEIKGGLMRGFCPPRQGTWLAAR